MKWVLQRNDSLGRPCYWQLDGGFIPSLINAVEFDDEQSARGTALHYPGSFIARHPADVALVEPAPAPDAFGPGKKFDTGKPRFDLLPAVAVRAAWAASSMRQPLSDCWFDCAQDMRRESIAVLAVSTLAVLEAELGGVVTNDLDEANHYPRALLAVARVLALGAAKYGPNNWQRVTPFRSRYFAAWGRHYLQWLDGLDADEESGEHHLAHAACCALFLLSGEVGHTPAIVEAAP